MRHEVTTVDDLRAIVGEPHVHVANKVKDRLSRVQREWLAHSPRPSCSSAELRTTGWAPPKDLRTYSVATRQPLASASEPICP